MSSLSTDLVPAASGLSADAGDAPQSVACNCAADVASQLRRWLGVELSILDADSGQVLHQGADQLPWDWSLRSELCREVARRGRPEFIDEQDPFLVLALPWEEAEQSLVAVGTFLTQAVTSLDDIDHAAAELGVDCKAARRWVNRQTPIAADTLSRMVDLVLERQSTQRRVDALEDEVEQLSQHVCNTYEEVSLIYRLTDNLSISRREDELARLTLGWVASIMPAAGLAVQLDSLAGLDAGLPDADRHAQWLTYGECPLNEAEFSQLLSHLNLPAEDRPAVVNQPVTTRQDWPTAGVQQLIVIPLKAGERRFGWLAAFNHRFGGEFGTVEADMLTSVCAILGIHRGNVVLYAEQAELLANIVRALTSAIDAKDPYTRGHSDRVARVAVRLAQELDCNQDIVDTIYLSGLLHDVGKIGINDQVLRKPGKLTDAEFEHIKTHAQIGYNILIGIRQLGQALPVVLHHHESWDGSGYPHGLAGEEIPFLARIVSVADAFDAMSSDRPYRKGMPDEKLDSIIRGGAAKQWDAKVVDAFFRAHQDIRRIAGTTPEDDPLDVKVCLQ